MTIRASKEVVLSAGAINTPQLLLLSGVGDAQALSSLGITILVHSPGVGANMQDHPLFPMQWSANTTNTVDNITRNVTLANDLLEQWEETRTGPLVNAGTNLVGWLRVPPNSTVLEGFEDPSAGPTSAHVELYPFNGFFSLLSSEPADGFFVSIVNNVVSPMSRGSVTLNSTDPFDFPLIDPGYLTHPLDVAIAVHSMRTAASFLSTEPWKDYVLEPYGALANATTDEELASYARDHITTFWHPSSTAKMGALTDEMAVVDACLRLKGAEGVRIVDASVFVSIIALIVPSLPAVFDDVDIRVLYLSLTFLLLTFKLPSMPLPSAPRISFKAHGPEMTDSLLIIR
ncbi:hypothetical protein EW146_g10441 [Bondarzewia mesenterica]|uniref:Glucose-methanol-choline oxidoreductase N-terminal domain-containing protein n=1 Tax=Bondarzewia mesenterica TaxID=1095465 RepID=A0A4S4KXE8_9AGAM|nr:hypothetical protein EW146_g10441 [Bondarzewia mesenterica]